MQAKHERRQYKDGSQVWVGKYRNSQNFPHWHYDCELVFVEKGSLNIFCNGHLLKVSAGRTVFIDSEQIHFLHALTPDATVPKIARSFLRFSAEITARRSCTLRLRTSSETATPSTRTALSAPCRNL